MKPEGAVSAKKQGRTLSPELPARLPVRAALLQRALLCFPPRVRETLLFGKSRFCLILQKIAQKLVGGPRRVVVRYESGLLRGLWFECLTSEKYFLMGPDYENDWLKMVEGHLPKGSVVYDVGSHAGFWTLAFSELCGPDGRVYAFEPSPSTFLRLQKNLMVNDRKNTTALNLALSDREGYAWLSDEGTSSKVVTDGMYRPGGGSQIQTVRLDDFVEKNRCLGPALIKIDVEGHAAYCLEGMKQVLRVHRPKILCEIHNDAEERGTRNLLSHAGYEVRRLETKAGYPHHVLGIPEKEN